MINLQLLRDSFLRLAEAVSNGARATWQWLRPVCSRLFNISISAGKSAEKLLKVGYAKADIQTIGYAGSIILMAGAFMPIMVIDFPFFPPLYYTLFEVLNAFKIQEWGIVFPVLGMASLALMFWKKYQRLWITGTLSFILLSGISIMYYLEDILSPRFVYHLLELAKETLIKSFPHREEMIIRAHDIASEDLEYFVPQYIEWGWGLGVLFLGAALILAYPIIQNFCSKISYNGD